ncbi:MAG: hypothetical protein IT321_10170 [Anaerolineae bacterium]|nr:hypothetical protein [Anaerolineae bacterium]
MSDEKTSAKTDKSPLKSPNTLETKDLLKAFGDYLNTSGSDDTEFTGYVLADGSYVFLRSELSSTLSKIASESIFSDRLWVIVSVAYLEDQLRRLLRSFLSDNEISDEILDPNQNLVSSLVPMAKLSFALGLITKQWYEILKRMAQLRNKFAHLPDAQNFAYLIANDPKSASLLESLTSRYIELTNTSANNTTNFSETYQQIFITVYTLLQFSIDYVAAPQKRMLLDPSPIVRMHHLHGMNKETLQILLDGSN